jgi:hypothetical protein
MSTTATLEPPVKDTAADVVLSPAGNAPTPAQKEAFLDIFRGKGKAPKEDITPTEKVVTETPKTETKADPVAKVEAPKEQPKDVPKETPKEEGKESTVERDFAGLRKKAEAAEKAATEAAAERDRLKAEYEEYRKKPVPEEFAKRLEATEKEKAEYQKRLRESDLARDPEFNARYDTGIKTAMQQMVDIVAQFGVERKEAIAAVSNWNKGQFAEWLDGMGPVEKLEFGAAMQQAITLYGQKEAELAQSEQTWQKRQAERQEAEKTQREQYLGSLRSDIEAIIKEAADTPLGKDHTEVLTEVKALLLRAGGLEGERPGNKDLLGMVGKSLLLAKGFERQEKALSERDAKIAELEKTVAERDQFIKDLNGSTPSINGSLPAVKGDRKAAARAILNPVIN